MAESTQREGCAGEQRGGIEVRAGDVDVEMFVLLKMFKMMSVCRLWPGPKFCAWTPPSSPWSQPWICRRPALHRDPRTPFSRQNPPQAALACSGGVGMGAGHAAAQ